MWRIWVFCPELDPGSNFHDLANFQDPDPTRKYFYDIYDGIAQWLAPWPLVQQVRGLNPVQDTSISTNFIGKADIFTRIQKK